MLGAVIGGLAGAGIPVFPPDTGGGPPLVPAGGIYTDTIVMTAAACRALAESRNPVGEDLAEAARFFLDRYGKRYSPAYRKESPEERIRRIGVCWVSPAGRAARTMEEALLLAGLIVSAADPPPETVRNARALAAAVYLASQGVRKPLIRKSIQQRWFPVDVPAETPGRDEVRRAVKAFLEASCLEEAVRKALAGDGTPSAAAMAGALAGSFHGIPPGIPEQARLLTDAGLMETIEQFEHLFPRAADGENGTG